MDETRLRRVLAGKTILITGASSGIGAATARLLGQPGVQLLLVARNEARLTAVCEQVRAKGANAHYYCVDFAEMDQVHELGRRIADEFPAIDVMISNAGKSIRRRLIDGEQLLRDSVRCHQINHVAPVTLLSRMLPSMTARGSGQIINVSSVSARLPATPYWAAYQSSKSAFDTWFQAVAGEVRSRGIHMGSVYFPLVHTPMSAPSAVFERVPGLSAEEAAGVLAYALISRKRRVAPWWLWPCEWMAILFRHPVDWILSASCRKSAALDTHGKHDA
ncbi:SDR family NAD(P)-dependent oxidoreductase [Paraburkholderia antibiotica]|uniref:SDR family NAD(P)-dependent oxidoreductase n=1 Tax=Paraburkholderia antibiotica TaxID=2728839 RepID=A0A7X9X6F3_9BURK|nr:SDR family NAD(P)-dependent oxidoreductase [Paraburkholderia antibiotica]NML32341.1 SDR family NAD(P)-dependent oxidoreductase [Paraburkholderia antibiotica]